MFTWASIALAFLQLFGALVAWASASRAAGESQQAALGRVLSEALKTIELAKDARAAAAKRDATDDGLMQDDQWRRD